MIGFEDDGREFQPKGWALVFHPDLIRGTSLGRNMKEYGFFSYEVNEALHLSERERGMVVDCFGKIRHESWSTPSTATADGSSPSISRCCWTTACVSTSGSSSSRSNVNRDVLTRFEELLDGYFSDGPGPARRASVGEVLRQGSFACRPTISATW